MFQFTSMHFQVHSGFFLISNIWRDLHSNNVSVQQYLNSHSYNAFSGSIKFFWILRFNIVSFWILRFNIASFWILRFNIVSFWILRFNIVSFWILRFNIISFWKAIDLSGETCTVADLPIKCKSLNSIGLAKWQTCQLFAQSLNYNVKNITDKLPHNNFETNSTQLKSTQQVL